MPSGQPYLPQSATQEWGTPHDLVDRLARQYANGVFDLDAAASERLHVCAKYFTEREDGLVQPWDGRVFVNPPYGHPYEERWVAKAVSEVLGGRSDVVVMLMPSKTGSVWWARYVASPSPVDGVVSLRYPMRHVEFVQGRIAHVKPDGSSYQAPFASVVLVLQDWLAPAQRSEWQLGGSPEQCCFDVEEFRRG